MSLKELTGKELNDWSGIKIDCACGERHELNASFFMGADAEENTAAAMQTLAPSGCGVLLLFEKGFDVSDTARYLRRGGYLVHRMEIERGAGFAELEKQPPSDDVRAVLAVGGGFIADCAKYIAAYSGLECGVVVRAHSSASFLVPSAAIDGGGMPQLFKTRAPKLIVCQPDKLPDSHTFNAAAFGSITSRLIALFDWKFSHIVRGEKLCRAIYETALGEIDGVLARLKGVTRDERGIKETLTESGLRLSALACMSGGSRLFSGGDTACALALQTLFAHEGRKSRLQGENEFLFALLLTECYPKLFTVRKEQGFLPPPDNNMRLEKLKEFFGVNERAAAQSITPYVPEKLLSLYDYRINEYSDELKEELKMLQVRLRAAYKIFKRLYSDDGYSLQNYMEESEARLCLALAPEMRAKFTALTHLKNTGVTDAYLLD